MVIREFSKHDRQQVMDFFQQMGGESRGFFNRERGNELTAMRFFDDPKPNHLFFMMEENNEMVGYLFFWDVDRSVPWLGIAVRDSYKGRGIGKQLMAFAEGYMRNLGKGGILLTTHIANLRGQGLYEGAGYEYLGVHTTGERLYLKRF